MTTQITERVVAHVRAHSPELRDTSRHIGAEDQLRALGIDSLELLSLSADLELAFDVYLDTAALNDATTVGDLVHLVTGAMAHRGA